MQSNSEFIANFSKKSAVFRELSKSKTKLEWKKEHEEYSLALLKEFWQDVLLRYFNITKPTFSFVDAHITGLGAMLAQEDDITFAKPVAFASRTISQAESRYPQLDLKAMNIDFCLRRFRDVTAGSPNKITIVTDHKPLCSIFIGNRRGSIHTERIKLQHQDIRYTVKYQWGFSNQYDYLSWHSKPMHMLDACEQSESEDLNNLL